MAATGSWFDTFNLVTRTRKETVMNIPTSNKLALAALVALATVTTARAD